MLKLIISLLIVTHICVTAQQTSKNIANDEVDITTVVSNNKDVIGFDDKQPSNEIPKSDDKQSFGGEENKQFQGGDKKFESDQTPKEGEFVPRNDGQDKFGEEKPIEKVPDDKSTVGIGGSEGKDKDKDFPYSDRGGDDKTDNKAKPDGFQPDFGKDQKPDFDLGKDHKRVDPKDNTGIDDKFNTEKDTGVEFGKDVPVAGPDATDGKQPAFGGKEPSFDGKEGHDSRSGNGKDYKDMKSGGVGDAGAVFDKLLEQIRGNFRSELESVPLAEIEPFKHGRWGSVKLHSGVVHGLTNVERLGEVRVIPESDSKKLLVGDIAVTDVEADYKANAKLFHRVSISNRELKLSLKKAIVTAKLEVDNSRKKLYVKDIQLKETEGFGVKSGKLIWPFNKLTDAIVKSQEHVIKDIIKKELSRYMGKAVENIPFDDVFANLF